MHTSLAEAEPQPVAASASVPASNPAAWFTCGRLLVLLFFFLLAAYPDVMLGSHTFFHRDFGLYGYPAAHYFRECFWNGELPLWNPLNDCGQPFAAQWGTIVFYPGSLLYLLVPLRWSLGFFCLAHMLLAGASMYALAHRWTGNRTAAAFAGLVFAANGLLMHSLMWPHYMATLAWMPLVVLWVERACVEGGRAVLIAALVGTMQMLAGVPEVILLTWLFLGCWILFVTQRTVGSWRAVLLRFSAVVGLVTGLAAIQLLPFLDLLLHSQRDTGFGTDVWAMPWWGPANFLLPLFHMTPSISGVFTQDTQQCFSSYYVGIVTVVLALWAVLRGRAPGTRWLAAMAVAAVVLAMGESGYVYAGLKRVLPVLGFMRFPVKWLMLVVFILPLLAALGLAQWQQEKPAQSAKNAWHLITLAGALVLAITVLVGIARAFPVPDEDPAITAANGVSRIALLVGATIGLLILNRLRSAAAWGCCGLGILVIAAADLLTHVPRQNPVVITRAFEALPNPIPNPPRPGESRAMVAPEVRRFLDYAKSPDELTYYLDLRRSLYANCNLIEGVPKVDGFWSLDLREYSQVRNLLYHGTNVFPAPLADFLGVTHLSSRTFLGQWDERPTAMPSITGGQAPVFADEQETLAALGSEDFRPGEVVYLRAEDENRTTVRARANVAVNPVRVAAHRWEFEITASAPALVVMAQSFYHPWKAQVDGSPQRLLQANHAFQALEVPAGRHRVTLTYVDWVFRAGLVASIATALLCAVLFWKWRSVRART